MSKITITRTIHAAVPAVFATVSDIRNFSKAIPDIVDVEFVTDQKTGAGTRFIETRDFKGRKVSTELEVTEYVKDEKVRIVSDSQGTVWDSVFFVENLNGECKLTLEMIAKPYKISARLMNLFLKRFIKKAISKDMDSVKTYCEQQ